MALRVPKAPGFASMMKEGAKYAHGKKSTKDIFDSFLENTENLSDDYSVQ